MSLSDSDDSSCSSLSSEEVTCVRPKYWCLSSTSDVTDQESSEFIHCMPSILLEETDEGHIVRSLKRRDCSSENLIYPRPTYRYIQKWFPVLAEWIETIGNTGWVYLSRSLMTELSNEENMRKPMDVLFDACIVSSTQPLRILSFTIAQSISKNLLFYNTTVANMFMNRLPKKKISELAVIHGVIGDVNCQDMKLFGKKLSPMETDARHLHPDVTLSMDVEKCLVITHAFFDILSSRSPFFTTPTTETKQHADLKAIAAGHHPIQDGHAVNGTQQDSLARFLTNRPSRKELMDKNIIPNRSESEKQTDRTAIGTRLTRQLKLRPSSKELEQGNILYNTVNDQPPITVVEVQSQVTTAETTTGNDGTARCMTPLHQASFEGKLEVVKFILPWNKEYLNKRGTLNRTPVMLAALKGRKDIFDFLRNEGCDLSLVDAEGNSVFNLACLSDNADFVKHVVALDIANINVIGYKGRTPLLQAAKNQCKRVFNLLVSEGADISLVDDDKSSVLNLACLRDNVDFVKYLLRMWDLDVNVRGFRGRTPVMQASGNGCKGVFDLLLSMEASSTIVDDDMNTILHIACLEENEDFVKYLTTKDGIDIDAKGYRGRSPVMVAASKGCRFVVELLVSEACDLSVIDDDGYNILHLACTGGNIEIVKYLLSLRIVDINSRTRDGQTPAQLAEAYGKREIFDMLAKHRSAFP